MNNEEKLAYVKEHLLDEALESMSIHGRYWNGSISRTLAPTLKQLINESGYNVHMREIPPHWEHVYYPYSDSDLIEKIAYERAAIKDKQDDYQNLPI